MSYYPLIDSIIYGNPHNIIDKALIWGYYGILSMEILSL
jgi:hypothetical protein